MIRALASDPDRPLIAGETPDQRDGQDVTTMVERDLTEAQS
jgi:hypothetical protein